MADSQSSQSYYTALSRFGSPLESAFAHIHHDESGKEESEGEDTEDHGQGPKEHTQRQWDIVEVNSSNRHTGSPRPGSSSKIIKVKDHDGKLASAMILDDKITQYCHDYRRYMRKLMYHDRRKAKLERRVEGFHLRSEKLRPQGLSHMAFSQARKRRLDQIDEEYDEISSKLHRLRANVTQYKGKLDMVRQKVWSDWDHVLEQHDQGDSISEDSSDEDMSSLDSHQRENTEGDGHSNHGRRESLGKVSALASTENSSVFDPTASETARQENMMDTSTAAHNLNVAHHNVEYQRYLLSRYNLHYEKELRAWEERVADGLTDTSKTAFDLEMLRQHLQSTQKIIQCEVEVEEAEKRVKDLETEASYDDHAANPKDCSGSPDPWFPNSDALEPEIEYGTCNYEAIETWLYRVDDASSENGGTQDEWEVMTVRMGSAMSSRAFGKDRKLLDIHREHCESLRYHPYQVEGAK